MLVQSQDDFVELLPALPPTWQSGSFRQLRVRGGAMVDLTWSHGKPKQVTLSTNLDKTTIRLKHPTTGAIKVYTISKGRPKTLRF